MIKTRPLWQELTFDLAGFGLTVVLALRQNWSATDLVWGLWISSLLLGFLYFFFAIGGTLDSPMGMEINSLGRNPLAWFVAIFMLAFFSFHFGFFHAGHSVFLYEFFPLEGVKSISDDFGVLSFFRLIFDVLWLYWPIVVLSAFPMITPFLDAYYYPSATLDLMGRPYANVIRMHIMILLLGFLSIGAGIDGFALYIILIFFFFPLEKIYAVLRGGKETE